MWKFALIVITTVGLGWVGLLAGVYILWEIQKQERKINEQN